MKINILLISLFTLVSWTCKDQEALNSEKEILAFTLIGQIDLATIISESGTIFQYVDTSIDLSKIAPQITISEGAFIIPASGQEVDFSNGTVVYTVTAEDNSTKKWGVTVETTKSDEANILSFTINRLQARETIINDTNVTIELKQGVSLASLGPEIVLSPKATVIPASLEKIDFSQGPVVYTVTSESGKSIKWLVTVATEVIHEADILSYIVPNQVGGSIIENANINIEVPVGTDISNIIPTITLDEGSTVEPQSGVAVDFSETGYVNYLVSTIYGSKKSWRVFVREVVIKANHPYIQYMGRIDYINPLKPRLHSAGASVFTKFQGTYCQILVEDQNLWGTYKNYIEIIVDNNDPIRMQLGIGLSTIDVVSGLTAGEHTLKIIKDTEADIGYIDFIGFRTDALLQPDDLPTRKMEFIGNSITCGYGVDSRTLACGTGEWYDNHNAYFAYGPIVSRRFNAQWMLSSVSGIGLIHSCCDKTYEMPDVYGKVNFSTNGNLWNFSLYQPDIVTICLGQNDGIQDSAAFVSAYINFIGTIRNSNPNAHVICMSSPMADITLYNAQQSYLTGVVDYLNNQGDTKVYKFYFTYGRNSGCDAHPNMDEHVLIADELEVFINANIIW